MKKNLMPQIAEMLGVEIGEEFKIVELSQENTYKLENDGLKYKFSFFDYSYSANLDELIIGEYTIKKLPQAPTLTQAERTILENLPKKYKYIARDKSKSLFLFGIPPIKDGYQWFSKYLDFQEISIFSHLFQFIKWEDEKPWNIEELLKGE